MWEGVTVVRKCDSPKEVGRCGCMIVMRRSKRASGI